MERLGIVGLPNSGKSSLFNALTSMGVEVAGHPFTTTGTNEGTAQVPDPRLDKLAELSESVKVVPAGLHVVDIAGLTAGASAGEGLGNQFLAKIREVDAILYVLRAFEDASVVYEIDPPDPASDLEVLETELCLADLEALEARLPKARKMSMAAQGDRARAAELAAMEAAIAALEDGTPVYRSQISDATRDALHDQFLLTNKPALYAVNVGEADLGSEADVVSQLREAIGAGDEAVIDALCASLEAEVAELDDPAEVTELLASYGVEAPARGRIARACYRALGKQTFLTTGPKESRAWTIPGGATASQAAGVIHSDFERGFIRAEVACFDEIVEAGGWDPAHKDGITRLEGKDYVVADGDVIEFRFNV